MRILDGWRFRRTTLHVFMCVAVLCGIGIGKTRPPVASLPIILFIPLVCWLSWLRSLTATIAIISISLLVGWQHGSSFSDKTGYFKSRYSTQITLFITATEDGNYGSRSQLSFKADHLYSLDGKLHTGALIVSGFGVNAIYQGDCLVATGKLYPAYGAHVGRMSFARLSLQRHQTSYVHEVRRKFAAGIQSVLPEPEASFAMGLLIGQRSNLPTQTKRALLMAGLTHIIAVSGYNLTILLQASKRLLRNRSKHLTFILSVSLIGVFLLITGQSASIVRAAIVSMLSIIAAYYGRTLRPVNLLLIAAVVTAWANPLYLWADVSWYLSFLAFFGVLVVAPPTLCRLPKRIRSSLISTITIESFCAELMTLPYVLYIFGQFSLVGLLANVMVVSLIPLAMLLCCCAGIIGMSASLIAGWLVWPATNITGYMLSIATVISRIPHGFIEGCKINAITMIILYAILLSALVLAGFKRSSKSAIVTDEESISSEGAKA